MRIICFSCRGRGTYKGREDGIDYWNKCEECDGKGYLDEGLSEDDVNKIADAIVDRIKRDSRLLKEIAKVNENTKTESEPTSAKTQNRK